MKKILLFVAVLMFTFVWSAQASSDVTVKINDETIDFPDQGPVINEDQRTLVPVRFVSEALGAEVEWDGTIKTVFINKENSEIQVTIGDRVTIVNGEVIQLDTEATIINERTMVPLRFVSEALGANVEWDANTKTVLISTGEVVVEEEKEEKVIDPYNLEQDSDLPDGILSKEQHWALDDLVVEKLTVENSILKGYLPELPDGFYYSLSYTAIDNLGNQHQKFLLKKEGESFEVDMSNEQLFVLRIVVYNALTDSFTGNTTVRFPEGEVWKSGNGQRNKVRVIDIEK